MVQEGRTRLQTCYVHRLRTPVGRLWWSPSFCNPKASLVRISTLVENDFRDRRTRNDDNRHYFVLHANRSTGHSQVVECRGERYAHPSTGEVIYLLMIRLIALAVARVKSENVGSTHVIEALHSK